MATTQETGWAGFSQQSKQEHFSLESQVAASAALKQYSAQLSACDSHLSGLGGSACPLRPSEAPLRSKPNPTSLCDPALSKCPSSKFLLHILQ